MVVAMSAAAGWTNPILPYDYSDPDVIRVGKNYYMTYSTFACIPGLQILHSRDGVEWSVVDAALPDTVPGYGHLDACPAGCGVWAPSIRHHQGRFYIYYGDPDIGIFCIRSEKTKTIPCRWEPAVLVKRGKGLIDPCPLWDSDGRCYLVHAFAGSRAGFKSALAVCELAQDGLSVIREENGQRKAYEVNLLDNQAVFNSPAYYLQQNDVIYVQPNKSQRVKGSTSYTWLSVGSTVVGMVVSIVSLIVALKR